MSGQHSIPQSMQSWVIRGYGGPEAMNLERVAVPQARPGEMLLRVEAASVNPADWKIREGLLQAVLPLSFPRVLGRDCVGIVVRLGEDCDGFAVGERVLAVADPLRDGTHAEFTVVAGAMAARVPATLPAADAACLGITGLSAWIPLVEIAALQPGQRILIHAGAGGVGGVAIQIAHHMGAEVLATCGSTNVDYCASLGAYQVIDYTRERFERVASGCDVVFDTVGGEVHRRSFEVLKPGGLLVHLTAAPIDSRDPMRLRPDVRVVRADVRASTARLASLLEWAAAGFIRPQVARTFPLAQAREAYALSAGGHVRGKLVLTT
jgi:NADPH:quinone reductase-like Zn-dependent oxidoreductase